MFIHNIVDARRFITFYYVSGILRLLLFRLPILANLFLDLRGGLDHPGKNFVPHRFQKEGY